MSRMGHTATTLMILRILRVHVSADKLDAYAVKTMDPRVPWSFLVSCKGLSESRVLKESFKESGRLLINKNGSLAMYVATYRYLSM